VQTPTHLATGVLIDQSLKDIRPGFIRGVLIALLSIYTHAVLDALSALTYHPPDPYPDDHFWLGYHAALTTLTLKVWTKHRKRHAFAMICSVLPDLDWVLIRSPRFYGGRFASWQKPALHIWLLKTLYALPPFWPLKFLPNLRQKKIAAISELIVLELLSNAILAAGRNGKSNHLLVPFVYRKT
jgi:hypothetical protein